MYTCGQSAGKLIEVNFMAIENINLSPKPYKNLAAGELLDTKVDLENKLAEAIKNRNKSKEREIRLELSRVRVELLS